MRFTAFVTLLFATSFFLLSSFAQTSFDQHYSLARNKQLGSRETQFAKACGVSRSSSTVTYGRSLDQNWTFKPVATVGGGRDDAEMDFLGNAELWSVNGKPRLLNIWFLIMDVGSSWNEMFCLDTNGRVLAQESLNVYEPVDGSGGGWRHLAIKHYSLPGRSQIVTSEYLDVAGKPISPPKLDSEDIAEANGSPSPSLAKDVIAKISHRSK